MRIYRKVFAFYIKFLFLNHPKSGQVQYLHEPFSKVITVCDSAAEACPIFPGTKAQIHWSFPDPSKATGSQEEQLAVYRSVRDAIRARIENELLKFAL